PVPLAHVVELLVERQPPGILRVTAVDHVAEREHRPSRVVVEPDSPGTFAVHHRHLLARPQIGYGLGPRGGCDTVGDAAAGTAPGQTPHAAPALPRSPTPE